jgi:hypothetical protein
MGGLGEHRKALARRLISDTRPTMFVAEKTRVNGNEHLSLALCLHQDACILPAITSLVYALLLTQAPYVLKREQQR